MKHLQFVEKDSEFSKTTFPYVALSEETGTLFFVNGTTIIGSIDNENQIILQDGLTYDDYVFYYEDEDGQKIDEFIPAFGTDLKLTNTTTTAPGPFFYFLRNIQPVYPYKSTQIGVYDKEGNKKGIVKITAEKPKNNRLFRFGVLSDVHHDWTYDKVYYSGGTEQGPQSASDFHNALKYFEEKQEVKFTCICGDLCVQNGETATPFTNPITGEQFETDSSHLSDLDSYRFNVNQLSPTTPVFVARGNHDIKSFENATAEEIEHRLGTGCTIEDLWRYYTEPENLNGIVLNYRNNDVNSADFYFEYGNKVFIFLSLKDSDFMWQGTGNAYNMEDLEWLHGILDENRNKGIFVFLHIFPQTTLYNVGNYLKVKQGWGAYKTGDYMSYKAGNYKQRYNINIWGSNSVWFNSDICKILDGLNDYYKNVVWFTGHSHIRWANQTGDERANITNDNPVTGERTSYTVHIPSGAYPRDGSCNSLNEESEGAVVDVYDDYVDIRGIAFKTFDNNKNSQWFTIPGDDGTGQYGNKYIPCAQYHIPFDGTNIIQVESKSFEDFKL